MPVEGETLVGEGRVRVELDVELIALGEDRGRLLCAAVPLQYGV